MVWIHYGGGKPSELVRGPNTRHLRAGLVQHGGVNHVSGTFCKGEIRTHNRSPRQCCIDLGNSRWYFLRMRSFSLSITVLQRMLFKLKEFFNRASDVHYTSVPVWKPWRDF